MVNVVVGSGISGATIARKIAEEFDEKVVVIEARNHIGGNVYDYKDVNGIMIHKYGSHIFHTNSEEVWAFVRRFSRFNTYMHKVIAVVDGIQTSLPFNLKSLYDVFPVNMASRLENKLLNVFEYNKKIPILEFLKYDDDDLKFLANYIYEKIFRNYTAKQWGKTQEIETSVTARVPVYISCDERYFQDKYQGIPLDGYTKMIENILDHHNISVKLNTSFEDYDKDYDKLFYTGSIDKFFDYEFGKLPYRSVYFEYEQLDMPYYQKNAVVNYPCNYDFTRIHEYKYYLNNICNKTVIAKEYSEEYVEGKNDPYYPIPNEKNFILYDKYLQRAKQMKNVFFLGRLGDYKYYNMDQAVARALDVFNLLKEEKNDFKR